jgi:hypothetical protein
LRRLSKSTGVALSVVLSIGLGIQVVNQAFVDHVFSGQNLLGCRVNGGAVIIGVVKNIKSRTIGEENRPVLFRSLDDASWSFTEKIRSFRCVGFLGRLYAAILPRVHFVRLH